MKLCVKVIDAPAVTGGKAVALCSEDGEMLPLQVQCVVESGLGEMRVTATFAIDGEQVRIV